MIRTIVLGVVGAIVAAAVDYRSFAILVGLLGGVAIAEYLRISTIVRQLQSRLESYEYLDNLRKPQPPRNDAQSLPNADARREAPPPEFGTRGDLEPVTMPLRGSARTTADPMAPITGQQPTVAAADGGITATETPAIPAVATAQTPSRASWYEQTAAARRRRMPGPLQHMLKRFSTTTRIGIVVLFFGVSFLLKYAAERGFFPIELRLLCVVALGAAIYQVGRKLQPAERTYGLLLRGAGIGIWYLSCYAAFSLYHLIGANLSFAVLVGLSGFTAWNAVRHNARGLAVFAIVGGFLAPILMSSGEGNHVVLFTYYAVVNAGIVAIARRQTWGELPVIGFLFTFVIGALWGATSYQPEFFASTEPFLLLSVAFYIAVPILFAHQAQDSKRPLYSGLIVFGTPAVAFVLQLALVADFRHGDTVSALLFGAAYVAVLLALWRTLGARAPLLRDAMTGIAAVFFTLAIAFAFDRQLAGALWAVEAAGGVWLSARQQRKWACYLSLLILAGAGALWLIDAPGAGERLLLNTPSLQIAVIALSGLVIAFILDSHKRLVGAHWPIVAAAWAAVWWLGGGIWQLVSHVRAEFVLNGFGLYLLCSNAALTCLYLLTARRLAGYLAGFSQVLLAATGLAATGHDFGPLHGLGVFVWPVAVAYLYVATYQLTGSAYIAPLARVIYPLAFTLTVAIAIAEFYPWFTGHFPGAAGSVIALTLPLWCAFCLLQGTRGWRVEFDALHRQAITGVLNLLLLLCFTVGLFVSPAIITGAGHSIVWPLNLLQLAVLLSFSAWWRHRGAAMTAGVTRTDGWLALGICGFLFANAVVLRFIHVHQQIPFDVLSLFRSDTVQMSMSVLWTLVGVVAVMWASRHSHSTLWYLGMGSLGVVVIKLFLVDLAQSGTIERIVSFIAVGLLLMTVGWKSPRPQRSTVAEPALDGTSPAHVEARP